MRDMPGEQISSPSEKDGAAAVATHAARRGGKSETGCSEQADHRKIVARREFATELPASLHVAPGHWHRQRAGGLL